MGRPKDAGENPATAFDQMCKEHVDRTTAFIGLVAKERIRLFDIVLQYKDEVREAEERAEEAEERADKAEKADRGWHWSEIILGFAIGLFVATLVDLSISKAKAHDAPSGWSYPVECCSSIDCYEISPTEIAPIVGGWMILHTGEFFSVDRVKPSGDGRWHRCSEGGKRNAKTICLFIPGGMS